MGAFQHATAQAAFNFRYQLGQVNFKEGSLADRTTHSFVLELTVFKYVGIYTKLGVGNNYLRHPGAALEHGRPENLGEAFFLAMFDGIVFHLPMTQHLTISPYVGLGGIEHLDDAEALPSFYGTPKYWSPDLGLRLGLQLGPVIVTSFAELDIRENAAGHQLSSLTTGFSLGCVIGDHL
ncbi:MAG: hypothetical protein AAGB22_03435 [Bacteroidota bacterium]